ncbi:MAG: electron transporter RnfG, partial [Peptoniphilus harei]|nr:electron transporter RnfG [Peptoniphilus harei]
SNGETSGFGSRITTDEYYPSYEGKSAAGPLKLSKDPKAEDEVMWLTSATISSKGALAGSNDAIKVYDEVLKNE